MHRNYVRSNHLFSRQIEVKAPGSGKCISVTRPTRMGDLSSTVFGGNILAIAVNAAYQTISVHITYRDPLCQVKAIRNTRTFEIRHIRGVQEADDGSIILTSRAMVTYTTLPHSKLWVDISELASKPSVAYPYGLYKDAGHFTDVQSILVDINDEAGEKRERKNHQVAPQKVPIEKFRVKGLLITEAENIACATLDFSLRIFTRNVNLMNYDIMEQKTIIAENARAFSEGRVWDEDGRLLASMRQQTILRPRTSFVPRI
ncbi:hypothetical protein BGW36DRAFT_414147 [Talaromyces proteolyticus]|uniref:Acyl-CoA thioesterase-like C-terminal domain-containing protein n=1 Tax=Talaromyces proteolyticus TaxID=1131652 RepID=A0AAD4KZ71_9EURO|nr:uncharacterized protein BGW36DRAFT_414147 [Talaromyces proteolyticus]KAH8703717.1 hypothetical protein BGW36DRAFT_414147 [Talaromyces proteolyticus]